MTQKTERHVEDALKVEATLRGEGRHYEADRIVSVIRSLRSAQAMVTRVTRETEAAVSPDRPSREEVERMIQTAPFADQEAGIPEMVAALRALLAQQERDEKVIEELRAENKRLKSQTSFSDVMAEANKAALASRDAGGE